MSMQGFFLFTWKSAKTFKNVKPKTHHYVHQTVDEWCIISHCISIKTHRETSRNVETHRHAFVNYDEKWSNAVLTWFFDQNFYFLYVDHNLLSCTKKHNIRKVIKKCKSEIQFPFICFMLYSLQKNAYWVKNCFFVWSEHEESCSKSLKFLTQNIQHCSLILSLAEMSWVVRERKCSLPGSITIAFLLMAGNSEGWPI